MTINSTKNDISTALSDPFFFSACLCGFERGLISFGTCTNQIYSC